MREVILRIRCDRLLQVLARLGELVPPQTESPSWLSIW
jgi:hypothetical protein